MSFIPPASSAAALAGIPFSAAAPIAAACKALFDAYDAGEGARDPSMCKALARLPGAVFWSSKLALDADGAAADASRLRGAQLDPADGQDDTSFHFADGAPLSSERHPFIVLPSGSFRAATGLALGDAAAVIYRGRIAAALCGDLGPVHKLGEASIRVHEAFLPDAPDPCYRAADGRCRRIRDVSIPEDVLTFAFPGSAFGAELTPANAGILIAARAFDLLAKLACP